jgi:hypothetical protein
MGLDQSFNRAFVHDYCSFLPKTSKENYLTFLPLAQAGTYASPHCINNIVARSTGFYNWQTSLFAPKSQLQEKFHVNVNGYGYVFTLASKVLCEECN